MALYVAICMLAALAAVSDDAADDDSDAIAIIWGTTIGLALAHWFAFRLSARLIAPGQDRDVHATAAGAHLAGAAAVALLATIPVILLPDSSELDAVRLVVAGFIAAVGYTVARTAGATHARALVYGLVILVIAAVVAFAKNALGGH